MVSAFAPKSGGGRLGTDRRRFHRGSVVIAAEWWRSPLAVLITGESGTGKELFARERPVRRGSRAGGSRLVSG
ncbi:sigma 54-interacting transcriptional regulator [Brevibacillus thermoruber]|uniref:sigma 54-interacting transcriptional regulator n=1 Tax=Brevibacillus thermoruber TaxID=33942 RepID=UPI003A5C4D2A